LEDRIAELRRALPSGAQIYHSLKSNPLPALIEASVNAGCRPEICSIGELNVALDTDANPALFLYSGPGKSEAEIQYAIANGVRQFSIESWVDLARLCSIAQRYPDFRIRCLLRVNPKVHINAGLAMSGSITQFGFEEEHLIAGKEKLIELPNNVSVTGFHIYYGTQIPTEDALVASFTEGIACAERLCELLSFKASVLDLGGGFPWAYAKEEEPINFDAIGARLESILAARNRTRDAELWFESGRYITASCGVLVTKVLDIKPAKDDHSFIVMDSGINHLGGMSGLGRVVRPYMAVKCSDNQLDTFVDKTKRIIVGPLCSPLDRLATNSVIDNVDIGDLLHIPNVGAYGLTASLIGFLSHPAPSEIVVRDNHVKAVYRLNTGHIKTNISGA
jgi:diaminopimelate decarboxylase